MNSIDKAITIVGVTAVLGGLVPAVSAQPPQPSTVQSQAVDFLNRGVDKAKRGDHRGAISDYTLAIRANPKLTVAYMNRGMAHHELGDFLNVIAPT